MASTQMTQRKQGGSQRSKGGVPTADPIHQQSILLTRFCSNLYSESEILKTIGEFYSDFIASGCSTKFHVDYYFLHIRLLIGAVAIAVAAYASLGLSFERQKVLLGCCVAIFFVLFFSLLLIEIFFLNGAMITFFDHSGSRHFMEITMDRSVPSITFRLRNSSDTKMPSCSRIVYLGRLFHRDGRLATEEASRHLIGLYESLYPEGGLKESETQDLVKEGIKEAQRELKEAKAD